MDQESPLNGHKVERVNGIRQQQVQTKLVQQSTRISRFPVRESTCSGSGMRIGPKKMRTFWFGSLRMASKSSSMNLDPQTSSILMTKSVCIGVGRLPGTVPHRI